MRICYATLVVLSCLLLAAGCRTNPKIAALQRDNRLKEDEIYRLRWQLEDSQEELQQCQRAEEGIGSESAPASRARRTILDRLGAPAAPKESASSDLPVQFGESISSEEFLQSRDLEEPSGEEDAAAPADGPVLPLPGPAGDSVPEPAWPEADEARPADEAPRWSPPSSAPGSAPETPPEQRRQKVPAHSSEEKLDSATERSSRSPQQSQRVAAIRVDPGGTGGHNIDGRGGDDGLLVLIQPLDEGNRPLRVPAEVSLVLLDPAFEDEAAHVARWDFTAEEVAAAIRSSESNSGGIPLKMVWRDKVPENETLRLFVRYTTDDGQRLEDEMEVRIRLSGSGGSSGWKTAPQTSPPAPPEADRATTRPEPPSPHTRFASRPRPPVREADTVGPPRLKRPQWSPERP